MKTIEFTDLEKKLLTVFVEERLKLYNQDRQNSFLSRNAKLMPFEKEMLQVMAQLLLGIPFSMTEKEKLVCSSCTIEHFRSLWDEIRSTELVEWLSLSAELRDLADRYDACLSILLKTNYFKRNHRTYSGYTPSPVNDIIVNLNKLTATDDVWLMEASGGDIYRIGFVHDNKELWYFEPHFGVSVNEIVFNVPRGYALSEYLCRNFTQRTNKSTAGKMIASRNYKHYSANSTRFLQALLN